MAENSKNQTIARRVSFGSIIANALLAIAKLLAGLAGHSAALVSDAIHSASDVLSTVIVLIGMKFSSKAPDREHKYGHERLECLSAIILAAILFATGAMIGIDAVRDMTTKAYLDRTEPAAITMYAAGASIIVKEVMYQITKRAAKRINSVSLMADAWHHRSDALSSIGSLAGVFATRQGFLLGDPIASAIICLFIIKAAVEIFLDAANKLTDTSISRETEDKMRRDALSIPGVQAVDSIMTRQFGSMIYVDIEISVEGNMPLFEAHEIAEKVHSSIERNFVAVKHCMVHVNPAE